MDSLFFDEKMFSNRSFIDTIPIGNRLNVEFCLYALSCRAFFCLKMRRLFWSLSPYNYNSNANVFNVNTNGNLNNTNVNNTGGAVALQLPVKISIY